MLTDIIRERDTKLWKIISEDVTHSLYELLPPKKTRTLRKRGHNFIAAFRQGGSTLNLQCPVSSRELCKVLANFDLMFSMCVCLIER